MKEEKSRIETTNAEDIKMILRLTETCAEYAFQSIENAKDLVRDMATNLRAQGGNRFVLVEGCL